MFLFLIRNRVFCSSNGLTMIFGAPRVATRIWEKPRKNVEFGKFLEETGFEIKINRLLGVFSSLKFESVNYLCKGREYLHCFFMGEIIGGVGSPTDEAEEIGWFYRDQLPPLSDGHESRINYGFDFLKNAQLPSYPE